MWKGNLRIEVEGEFDGVLERDGEFGGVLETEVEFFFNFTIFPAILAFIFLTSKILKKP